MLDFIKLVKSEIGIDIIQNEPMKNHTSFKIGGNADMYCEIDSEEKMQKIYKLAKNNNIDVLIIGNGTNILVKDGGIEGLVIHNNIKNMELEKNNDQYFLKVGSGVSLKEMIEFAADKSVGDLAPMYGIPATVGGAIKMNAGAFGKFMEDYVYMTKYMDENGDIHEISLDEHDFSYKHSIFSNNNYIILSAILSLVPVDKNTHKEAMKEIINKRVTNQPLDYPSAGSTFKRGADFITSKVIDDCGLKGLCVNDAEVSKKHAGFIINKGNAKAKDVLELIDKVKEEILKKENKKIELEVIVLGRD